jgi:hypothetical protein
MGLTAIKIKSFLQNNWVRRASGLLVIGFGLAGVLRLL